MIRYHRHTLPPRDGLAVKPAATAEVDPTLHRPRAALKQGVPLQDYGVSPSHRHRSGAVRRHSADPVR